MCRHLFWPISMIQVSVIKHFNRSSRLRLLHGPSKQKIQSTVATENSNFIPFCTFGFMCEYVLWPNSTKTLLFLRNISNLNKFNHLSIDMYQKTTIMQHRKKGNNNNWTLYQQRKQKNKTAIISANNPICQIVILFAKTRRMRDPKWHDRPPFEWHTSAVDRPFSSELPSGVTTGGRS